MFIARPFERLTANVRSIFLQGLTPPQLSVTIGLGIILGVFPFFYVPTLLVLASCAIFRLNLTVMMIVNWLVYPLQILLLIPFVQVGAWVTRSPVSLAEIQKNFSFTDLQATFSHGLYYFLNAMAGWFVCCIPLFLLVHFSVLLLHRRFQRTASKEVTPAQE